MPNMPMSVPGASLLMNPADQTTETEEQRKKRLQALQAARMMPSTAASGLMGSYGAATGS